MGNIFGGTSGFDSASVGFDSASLLSGQQQDLFGPLRDFFLTAIQNAQGVDRTIQKQITDLIPQLSADTTQQSKQLAFDTFKRGLLDPALASFQRDVAPSINENFAKIGGALSSRRGTTIANSLTDITKNAESSLAKQLPAIYSFPLQQTLGQISGLSQLQQTELAPLAQALQFALTTTVQNAQRPYAQKQNSNFGSDLIGAVGSFAGKAMA